MTLTGVVRDEAGKGIAEAMVTQGSSPLARDHSFHLTATNGEGRFSLRGVRVGADLLLTATAAGRSPEMVRGIVGAVNSEFAFTLGAGHVIKFRVVDERGEAVAGAYVTPISWKGEDVLRPYANRASERILTDGDGRVEWDSAPAEAVQFFLGERHHRTLAVEVSPSEKENVFTLRDPMHVTVNVVDAQTKAVVPEFAVTLGQGTPEQPSWWGPTKVGLSGSYELPNVEGHELVKVEATGYPAMIEAIPTEKSTTTMTFSLSKGTGANVAFMSPEGKAAADLTLYVITAPTEFAYMGDIHTPTPNGTFPMLAFTTDGEGKCSLGALPEGRAFAVVAFDDAGFLEVPGASVKNGARFTLVPWCRIEGVSKHGEKGAAGERIGAFCGWNGEGGMPAARFSFHAETDAAGRFLFPTVPPKETNVGRSVSVYPRESKFYEEEEGWWQKVQLSGEAGKRASVVIGGTGRRVVGRVSVAAGGGDRLESVGMVMDLLPPSTLTDEEVAALRKMSGEERERWWAGFRASSRGKASIEMVEAFYNEHPRKWGMFPFVVHADGRFEVDDVPAGEFTLKAGVRGAQGEELGSARMNVVVGSGEGVVDLGEIRAR